MLVSAAAVRDTPRSETAVSDTPEVRDAPPSEAAVSKTPEAGAADIKRHTALKFAEVLGGVYDAVFFLTSLLETSCFTGTQTEWDSEKLSFQRFNGFVTALSLLYPTAN